MRNLYDLDAWRDRSDRIMNVFGSFGNSVCGAFWIPYRGLALYVIACSGEGWDHVSASLKNRCPTWEEMEHVKRMFFKDDECAMQLHVPVKDHISFAHTALHLWRPLNCDIPRPPAYMVGAPRGEGEQEGGKP
jgi:hypothetical protein